MLVHVNPISSVSGTFTQKVLEDKIFWPNCKQPHHNPLGKEKTGHLIFAYSILQENSFLGIFAEQVACFVDMISQHSPSL